MLSLRDVKWRALPSDICENIENQKEITEKGGKYTGGYSHRPALKKVFQAAMDVVEVAVTWAVIYIYDFEYYSRCWIFGRYLEKKFIFINFRLAFGERQRHAWSFLFCKKCFLFFLCSSLFLHFYYVCLNLLQFIQLTVRKSYGMVAG